MQKSLACSIPGHVAYFQSYLTWRNNPSRRSVGRWAALRKAAMGEKVLEGFAQVRTEAVCCPSSPIPLLSAVAAGRDMQFPRRSIQASLRWCCLNKSSDLFRSRYCCSYPLHTHKQTTNRTDIYKTNPDHWHVWCLWSIHVVKCHKKGLKTEGLWKCLKVQTLKGRYLLTGAVTLPHGLPFWRGWSMGILLFEHTDIKKTPLCFRHLILLQAFHPLCLPQYSNDRPLMCTPSLHQGSAHSDLPHSPECPRHIPSFPLPKHRTTSKRKNSLLPLVFNYHFWQIYKNEEWLWLVNCHNLRRHTLKCSTPEDAYTNM